MKLPVQILPLGHDESEEITKEATCSEEGEKIITCARCDEERTEKIPKAAHAYGDWKVTKEATKTQEGERQRACETCGEVEKEAIAKIKEPAVPEKPGTTTKPGNTSKPQGNKTNGTPKTGDNDALVIWLMLAGSMLVLGSSTYAAKRKREIRR